MSIDIVVHARTDGDRRAAIAHGHIGAIDHHSRYGRAKKQEEPHGGTTSCMLAKGKGARAKQKTAGRANLKQALLKRPEGALTPTQWRRVTESCRLKSTSALPSARSIACPISAAEVDVCRRYPTRTFCHSQFARRTVNRE
jgi:hypothetical protein